MIDDLIAPKDTLTVKFNGKNPFAAVTIVPQLLRSIMKITTKDVLETDVRWDTLGPMRQFYGMWMGKRYEDRWTTTRIRIIIQGEQHPADRTGSVNIELKGTLLTVYEYSNFIQRSFWWFYNYVFYNKQRRVYLEEGKDKIYEMRDIFQRTLGIEAPR